MANKKQVALLQRGVEKWNAWRDQNRGIEVDLRDAKLLRANLRGANLGARTS